MNLGIAGKYALVTGGSHGIGRSIALALADEGCNVAICARRQERLDIVAGEIHAKGVHTKGIRCDVEYEKGIETVVDTILFAWHKLDILVNNVGGGGRWGDDVVEKTSFFTWEQVFTRNALSAVQFTMRFLPAMIENNWGRVVSIASTLALSRKGKPWYTMAKAAEIALMNSLAGDKRLARHNITFNSVAPGAIMIPNTGWDEEQKKDPTAFSQMLNEHYVLGRLGTPDEIANAVVFLCSEKASLINGACIIADGGGTS